MIWYPQNWAGSKYAQDTSPRGGWLVMVQSTQTQAADYFHHHAVDQEITYVVELDDGCNRNDRKRRWKNENNL
ncbi:MAG: hypothetical protein M2R45_05478 [Verrucomicrobia subdivision 3 bacterium]|nr:hypothetical protein [Limisphaerales bacterium]